ncbi:MAG: flagellar hook-associated protein FlgK [Oceanospirillales bacterium]|uniref:Flagellar hook-associated protein 1 n=1 Tax=Marinobacterium halophilum TaxID=267374 RepID=A0A2P8ESA0_9GAMM|nr:flagellar hook-associated protein FlgK [Marinobacterium halophilum]MBR9827675.1 flagellar hook-associated protein FlgK [Oceanospirillales bacterium]PSL12340.1 flagellar hook-associated protein 1 FlgK [Marinobacterium halophilum]
MSYGLLNLGSQALSSNQSALSVVGQNIANVNTDGYSRQRPEFASREGLGGVEVYDISRIADQFLNRQIWADKASYSNAELYQMFAGELDNLLASEATSISSAMDTYFGALQTAVDDPTSLPNRELFVAEANALVQRLNDMDANLERQNNSLNGRLESSTAQVNAIASNIAELNDKLRIATAAGSQVNELLDKRDAQLDKLSNFVNFTTVDNNATGEVNVFIGKGEPLVMGKDSNRLVTTVDPADASRLNVSLQIGNNVNDITAQIGGGEIGGLLDYRDNMLDTARDQIGIITLAFADTMNSQHMKGMDLDGELGGHLFTDINDPNAMANRVLSDGRNTVDVSSATVHIDDTSELKASEYKVIFGADNSFTMVRESDGKQWNSSQFTTAADAESVDGNQQMYRDPASGELTLRIDGFTLSMDPAGNDFGGGDQFVIRPARTAASDIDMVLQDPRDLALASPVKIEADAGNEGTGVANVTVTRPEQLGINNNQLGTPIKIEFSEAEVPAGSGNMQSFYRAFDVSDPDNPIEIDLSDPATLPIEATPFVAGEPLQLPGNVGYEVVITNQPKAGDTFTVGYNEGGVSDNRNALAMSDLQFDKSTVDKASYQDRYGQLIERVGTQTAVAQINAEASKSVLDANLAARASVSGVNLDEEAAKLIQFQQAYSASAQLIRASQTIFDALIGAI